MAGRIQTSDGFAQKLASLDKTIRHRLATETPDDVVTMYFCVVDGKPDVDTDWQPITEGSPGTRTAAMLAFVLHHGNEPLVLDQPEDDLDSEWISKLVVQENYATVDGADNWFLCITMPTSPCSVTLTRFSLKTGEVPLPYVSQRCRPPAKPFPISDRSNTTSSGTIFRTLWKAASRHSFSVNRNSSKTHQSREG